jgi:hypothetical protein
MPVVGLLFVCRDAIGGWDGYGWMDTPDHVYMGCSGFTVHLIHPLFICVCIPDVCRTIRTEQSESVSFPFGGRHNIRSPSGP